MRRRDSPRRRCCRWRARPPASGSTSSWSERSSSPSPARTRRASSGSSRAPALFHEVLGGYVVEELLELVDDLLLALVLVLELDRRLRDHVLGGEDRRARPDREREGVRGAGGDLDPAPVP